jgi:hypothetical protein
MCIFMDWFLFDRDLPGVDLPPIKLFYRNNKDKLIAEDQKVFKELAESVHSIFQMRRARFFKSGFIVEDLFSGKRYKVNDPRVNQAFSRGDIFEARLLKFKGEYEFSKGFCFHPMEMRGFIINEIKKVRYQDKSKHTKLIFQLSNMKLKHQRYQHIEVKHVYRFDSKL